MEDIDWNKKGVDDFLQLVQSTLQQNENTKAINSQTQHDISKILFTAVMAALRDRDIFSNVLSALNSLLDNPMTMEYIIDVISVIDLETIATDDSDQRTNFINFLSLLQPNLPEDVLKERLDLDTLEAISLLKHTDNFNKRYIKTRTKLYYKQQKFNLFREENEGYSKLITELCNESAISKSQFLINIKSLIGKFNLDPNRVVDILLEVLECNPGSSSFFVEVLKDYVVGLDSLPSILGFKFQNYANDPKDTPESLFLVTAILVANDVISLSEIYPHLYPEDEVIIEQHEQAMSAARQTANRLSVAVLSEKEKDKNSDDKDSTSTASSIENQKFGLIEQMIVIGDWKHAQMMLNRFPQFYPVSQGNIAYHMCQLLHYIVEPLYSKLNHSRKSQISLSPYTSNLLPEKCKDFHDISKEFMQILSALGPFCSIDLLLMSKILRLFENYLLSNKGSPTLEHEKQLILCCLDECLIPSLSLLNANCHFSDAVWNVLKHFPYQDRYNLYHEWKTNVISMEPSLILRRSKVTERAKYVMKRLSKDTVKSMGRNLAKLSHCCPTVVFDYVLSQLQKYDNLCLPLIDALKMLTPMSFDVLVYCLIETLSDPTKSRINKENASIELWIYSLSTFSGALFKKFTVDTTGLIQYIANQLKAGNNFNLIILKEIVSKMTGVKIFDDLTEDELSAHGGGEFLKSEAAFQGLVRQSQKSSRRLKDTMLEHHLAFPLCILLANHRDSIVYNDGEEGHLKLIGSLYDECQDAFVQMVEFLDVSLSLDEFEALPDLDTLSSNYELSPDAAFYLSRPKLNRKINFAYEQIKNSEREKSTDKKLSEKALASAYKDAVDKICSPLLKMVECLQPIKVWDHLNPQFYLTFWSLGLYDIHCPTDAYDKEISKLNSQIKTVESSSDFSENKKKKEKEKLTLMVDKLKDECKKHNEHVIRVMARLKLECPQWFPSRTGKSECIVRLQQTCLIPRTLFSTPDAVFCAQFFVLVHTLKTVNFPTLLCLDRLFTDLVYSLASFTENEARRYGRFLHAILTVVTKWHGDKTIYDRECSNYPGFFMSVRNTSNLMSGGAGGRDVILDYDNFRHVCYKWQFKIARDVITCLETGDYIQIRNTIIVLTKLIPHFPRCTNLGIAVEKRIEKVRAEEKDNRQDLCMLATSYIGKLKQHKPKMMAEEVFHNKKERENKLQKQAPKSKHPLTNGTDNSVSPVNAKKEKVEKVSTDEKKPVRRTDTKPESERDSKKRRVDSSRKSVEDTKVKTEA